MDTSQTDIDRNDSVNGKAETFERIHVNVQNGKFPEIYFKETLM